MTRRRRTCIAAAIAVVITHLAAGAASGDPEPPPVSSRPPDAAPLPLGGSFIHLQSSSNVHTDGGSDLRLHPGFYVDEDNWHHLDAEFRRLQDAETRLEAENKSLRESTSGWQPGWKTLFMTLVVGTAGGVYLRGKL